MAKLDVELGKAVGIQRTKAGSGDKEEAFLIRSTLLKFAGAFCLVFLIVGGLAIFLSQWEVSFQKGINLDERVEHEAVEQEAFAQFMQVGSMLTNFLRGESHQKQTVQLVELQITKAVDELVAAVGTAASSDDVRAIVDTFSDKIYSVLDEYSDIVGEESSRAKDLLEAMNTLLADDDVMPESHEKIRPVQGTGGRTNAVHMVSKQGAGDKSGSSTGGKNDAAARDAGRSGKAPGGGRGGAPPQRRPRIGPDGKPVLDAKARLAALGGDLTATINRVFDRVDALRLVAFPDAARDALVSLQMDVMATLASAGDLAPLVKQFQDALRLPGVHGVDVATAASSDRQMVSSLKEIVQLFPVMDHVEALTALREQWEARAMSEGEVMHALHKMTRDKVLPFEWVAGRNLLGPKGGKRPGGGAAGGPPARGAPNGMLGKGITGSTGNLLARQEHKYQWWSGLKEAS